MGTAPLREIPIDELREGMYVVLPLSWSNHPFLKGSFRIKSREQIREIAGCGLTRVPVDPARSVPPPPTIEELEHISHQDPTPDPREGEPPAKWSADTLVPDALREALADHSLPPERKSRAVYENARVLMERLLESPTAESLRAGKQAINQITDLILSDDATAANLLRITTHDFYTYTHSVNVGVTSLMLSKALFADSDAHDLHELGAGFFLHDLGKVRVDPAIINKPGRLTDEEMQRVRIHPYQGYKLLKEANALSEECRLIIMQHHEFADGTGYPKGLHNEEIHLYGRICGIADVFDALTAERSYKKAMTPFDALTLMKEKMSAHFDRELFSRFVMLFR
ncbi:HD-GYP domain-containing protein [Endothiovibrio diazotrophicus]